MEAFKMIKGRRSVRQYKNRPVKKADLLKMLEAATMAPSHSNLQPWYYMVITNKKIKEKLVKILTANLKKSMKSEFLLSETGISSFYAFIQKAPVVIVAAARVITTAAFDKYFADDDRQSGFSKNAALISTAASAQNLLLSAHALGYGACWILPPFKNEDIKELLKLEAGWHLVGIIPVGIPNEKPKMRRRKSIEQIAAFLK